MTPTHKQIVISVKDLRFAVLLCSNCNTRVTLDLEVEFNSPARAPFRAPRECPRCNHSFGNVVPPAIEELQKVYKVTAELGDTLTFAAEPSEPAKA